MEIFVNSKIIKIKKGSLLLIIKEHKNLLKDKVFIIILIIIKAYF